MTKDDIIRMARDAQIIVPSDPDDGDFVSETVEILTTFADSVAASAAAAEREACAVICEELELPDWPEKVRQPLAEAIRARSQS